MRHATMAVALGAALALPFIAAPVHAQSFLTRLGQSVSNAVTNKVATPSSQANTLPATNDGLHNTNGIAANWNFPTFAPDTLDGYTHLRSGTAALDPFGNGVGGRATCDADYVGHDLLHQALDAREQQHCLSLEQLIDSSATIATLNQRMATLAGQRRFYVRGNVHLYVRVGPHLESIPPGQVWVEWVKASVPVNPAYPTSYLFVGPNWDTRGVGDTYHFLQPMTLASPSKAGELSYVFFTVGAPSKDRNPLIWDIPVTVDKIVVVDDQSTHTLTPAK